MRSVPDGLQAHLDSGATTLCWCWRVDRRDGVSLGFTDHDRLITFDDLDFLPDSGFSTGEFQQSVGLSVDNADALGALRSDILDAGDLANGLYDNATVAIYRVNWSDVTQRLLLRRGSIGEVSWSGNSFTAEVRGLSHLLQQEQGRTFQYACDADLGDGRCGVQLSNPSYTAAGVVTQVHGPRRYIVEGLQAFQSGWFTQGHLTWTSGGNTSAAMEVRRHFRSDAGDALEVWHDFAAEVQVSDEFTVSAGCDKTFATCSGRFGNTLNYRGFPHMPGNDFVLSVGGSG